MIQITTSLNWDATITKTKKVEFPIAVHAEVAPLLSKSNKTITCRYHLTKGFSIADNLGRGAEVSMTVGIITEGKKQYLEVHNLQVIKAKPTLRRAKKQAERKAKEIETLPDLEF